MHDLHKGSARIALSPFSARIGTTSTLLQALTPGWKQKPLQLCQYNLLGRTLGVYLL
jgi:hypothetical protein